MKEKAGKQDPFFQNKIENVVMKTPTEEKEREKRGGKVPRKTKTR